MRFKLKENFESVYLRETTLRRALHKADPNLIHDTEFKRITKYIAGHIFNRRSDFLKSYGFDFEDLLNIVNIFGLCFHGMGGEYDSPRGKNLVMINFIQQRINGFFNFCERKFRSAEGNSIISFSDPAWKYTIDCLSAQPVLEDTDAESLSVDDRLFIAQRKLDIKTAEQSGINTEIDARIAIIRKELSQNRNHPQAEALKRERKELIATKRMIRVSLAIVKADISALKREKDRENVANTHLTKQLRENLDQDWEKHQNTLAYYSTSRLIDVKVRQKAREYCRKYGIDYIGWAKKEIERTGEPSFFVL